MTTKIIKCFIASPSDTQAEREICDKVFTNVNKKFGDIYGIRFESLRWEFDTYPSFKGEYSQQIISSQLGTDYQLFVGIIHQKFGTPTKVADSGTLEEFSNAYKKLTVENNIDIMFYFNNQIIGDVNNLDLNALTKIREFKTELQNLNGLYQEYNGTCKFEDLFENHLVLYLKQTFKKNESDSLNKVDQSKQERITKILNERFIRAISTFNTQPPIWIEPIISLTNEISSNPDENYNSRIPVNDLIIDPHSTIIKSPPQFGLTCLGLYLVKQAWKEGQFWLYLDAESLKPHNAHNSVVNEVNKLDMKIADVKCIVIDNWFGNSTNSFKILKSISDTYKDVPIFVLYTVDDSKFFNDDNNVTIDRDFSELHLLALARNQVRKIVCEYNKVRSIGEEDIVLNKVASDLEALNIHRTPINCLTLLKVSEQNFDNSPVNRTAMLEMVLGVLFVTEGLPTYKSKPDLKDCEYILGRFCENLIRNDYYEFSRDSFIKELKTFCSSNYIELEVEVVFDILAFNNIIIIKGMNYAFKSSYWIFYFAAKRMHNNQEFSEFIFSSKKYISFPEIIEFYTGIDRNRTDAIKIMHKDISETCDTVISKVGITETMDPLSLIQWTPTEEQIIKAQNEISDNVVNSTLPEALKDQHADKSYNQIQPYNQSIQSFFEEYSVMNLMQNIKAASRALRNSDYVDPALKKSLLKEIMRSWEQISVILFALTPVLATKGRAKIEGASFELSGDFGETYEERVNRIIQVNPTNVVGFFRDDISSEKIGPLLYEQFNEEKNHLKKHHLALLLIFCRPKQWQKNIENYIVALPKNSFYLFATVNALKSKYKYDFLDDKEFREVTYLLKMGLAKHQFGNKKPTPTEINKIPKYFLPTREEPSE